MLFAYLDESGTDDKSPSMCVGGLLYEEDALRQLDAAWKAELEQMGVRYFHAVEEAHGRGEFEGKDRGRSDKMFRQLVGLVQKHACGGMSIHTIPEREFAAFCEGKWQYSQYTTCAYICIGTLAELARTRGHNEVSFVIEDGHADAGELRTLITQRKEAGWTGVGACQFLDKRDVRPLQSADLWAYEVVKHHRNRLESPDRKPRKSLMALIEGKPDMRHMLLNRPLLHRVIGELSGE